MFQIHGVFKLIATLYQTKLLQGRRKLHRNSYYKCNECYQIFTILLLEISLQQLRSSPICLFVVINIVIKTAIWFLLLMLIIIIIIVNTSTSDLQPSTAIENQLIGKSV